MTTTTSIDGGVSFASYILRTEELIADQRAFAKEVDGVNLDPTGLVIPQVTPGFGWGLWTPKGWTPQREFEAHQGMGIKASKYTDASLDIAVPAKNNVRNPDKQYLLLCRDQQEADQELANTSANQIKEQQILTLTLAERLRLGRWFFWKTGQHLDIENWTLCSGSRDSGGGVPCVCWRGGSRGVGVGWYGPDGRDGDLRSRQAVS